MKRRSFLGLAGTAALGRSVFAATPARTKRERMLAWLAGETTPNYTPAAFFLHFGEGYKAGLPAARRHLEFFRQTDMDFVKIQFEQTYSRQDFLQKPSDWSRLKLAKLDFYEPLLVTVRELVKAEKKNSLILMTLYSPFMCAGHCATAPVLLQHMSEDPEAVKKGLEILTESQMLFVRACIREGVDGFYASTQGGEAHRLSSPELFTKYVKPFDLVAMKEAAGACPFNILHVCDYVAPYSGYAAYTDYPGHVVNCNTALAGSTISGHDVVKMFRRPFMGGMNRHGIIATGSQAEIAAEVRRVVKQAPSQFILGADCTVEANTDWARLKQAISVAHGASV
ncbi:MAG TPA: uroporphyrinogen decarboxylase family protein [Bryobacteraceae bacterium]|nr:uroporphyrinogen decarboxylase family protein [Bryobacteraceae bacterium]